MFNDPLISAYKRKLVESSVRQKVISQNLANAETPNYKAFRVVFDQASGQVLPGATGTLPLARTHSGHIGAGAPGGLGDLAAQVGARLVRDSQTTLRNDRNNVDVDRELADLASNQLYYTAVASFTQQAFSGFRTIIAGRSG